MLHTVRISAAEALPDNSSPAKELEHNEEKDEITPASTVLEKTV